MSKRLFFFVLTPILLGLVAAAVAFYLTTSMREVSGVVRDSEARRPLVGAAVSAEGANASTNSQGEYSLRVPRGNITLAASADGYTPAQVQIDASDPTVGHLLANLELAPNRVMGVVRDGERGQPIPNAPVRVGDQSVTTNSLGVFQARGVKSGAMLSVTLAGYEPLSIAYRGQNNIDVKLMPQKTGLAIVDKFTNEPVPNAQVQIGGEVVSTDAQGHARLRSLRAGVTVHVTAAGYEKTDAPYGGGNLQIALRPNVLDGTVTDKGTGKPISDTLVYLGNSFVATNAQGAYHFDNVPENATVDFKVPGYRKLEMNVASKRQDAQLVPFLVKGIHLPFGMKPDQVRADIDLAAKTELNAIVLDVKAEKGPVAWDSKVPLAKEIGAPYLKGIDLLEVVERCRVENVYCIARMPVFQDTRLANAHPELALKYPDGKVYRQSDDQAWTDPSNPAVWDYDIALAKEVAAIGFDEIQFDYVRFPGHQDGLYSGATATEAGRVSAITGFLARAQKELRPTGVFLSVDVFGLTVAAHDDQYTGQRLQDMGPYVDYIAPMVYPAVWSEGSYLLSNGLGIANCTEAVKCPYDVIYNSYKRATERTSTKVRLWLQAYAGKGNFGVPEYRLQKKAAEDAGSQGWMFWNASGQYDPAIFAAK